MRVSKHTQSEQRKPDPATRTSVRQPDSWLGRFRNKLGLHRLQQYNLQRGLIRSR